MTLVGQLSPDVIFLDIGMPEQDGFSVVEALGASGPLVVFVTAYDEHAIRAFDEGAVDYVLKPLEATRLSRAVERVRQRLQGHRRPERLYLRDGATILAFDVADIEWIASERDYVRIRAGHRSPLIRQTIGSLEQRLEPNGFMRIHRSALVNPAFVDRVEHAGDRAARVVMRDGTALKVSRTLRSALLERLGSG